jgi:hypothetical protein
MATTFDHKKESFFEALGFDKKDINDINIKLANSSKYIIMELPQQSELCEHIAKEFSYNELLFMATLFVTEKTGDIIKQNPEVLVAMKLKALFDELKDEEEH